MPLFRLFNRIVAVSLIPLLQQTSFASFSTSSLNTLTPTKAVIDQSFVGRQAVVEPLEAFYAQRGFAPHPLSSYIHLRNPPRIGVRKLINQIIVAGSVAAIVLDVIHWALGMPVSGAGFIQWAGVLPGFKLRDRLPASRPFRFLYEGTSAQANEPGHLDFTGPDWQRLNIVGWVALDKLEELHRAISSEELVEGARQALDDYYLPASDDKIHELINYLVRIGVLSKGQNSHYHLILAPDIVAIKFDAVEYISRHLHEALDVLRDAPEKGSPHLITLLRDFSSAVLHWPRYPVEAQLPVLKAIRILPKSDRKLLEQFLLEHDRLRDAPLVDAILLMFGHIPENWGARFVSYLQGADLYIIACEIWNAVGGLGRVCIYRAISMVRLLGLNFARVITHEPHWAFKPYDPYTPPESQVPLDYAQLPIPVENLAQVGEFPVRVNNENVPASVSQGTNRYGIHIRLIGDLLWKRFTRAVYRHGHEFGARTKREFMSFYRQAVMYDIVQEQKRKQEDAEQKGLPYTPTVIFAEDGQIGPLVGYKRFLDRATSVLWYAVMFFFTHTVFNREWFDAETDPGDHTPIGDATSQGVRSADAAAAVSAFHLDVIAAPRDSEARIVALTNGAFIEALNESFMEIWNYLRENRPDLFLERDDPDNPTMEQYREFKREAKRRVGLNPDQITVGSTGRLVDEKAGLKRAYESSEENRNVDAYVGAEAQVLLLGNVQSHTKHLWEVLEKMAWFVNGKGYKGRLHIEKDWDIRRQIEIMRALDVIVFDSDPGTEAAGLSEALATFFGAKVVGPSSLEGLINKQGMPKNRRHRGNTVTPLDQSPKAFREAIMGEIRQYKEDPNGFIEEAIFSRTLSWVLNSDISTAWDLREANRAMSFKLNPLLALVPYLGREPESDKYFRPIWVRQQLVEALEKNPEVTPLESNNPNLKSFVVPFEVESGGVIEEIPFLVNISLQNDPGTISGLIWGAKGFTALVAPEPALPHLQVELSDSFTNASLGSRMLGDVDKAKLYIIVKGGIEVLRMKRIVFPNTTDQNPFGNEDLPTNTKTQSASQAGALGDWARTLLSFRQIGWAEHAIAQTILSLLLWLLRPLGVLAKAFAWFPHGAQTFVFLAISSAVVYGAYRFTIRLHQWRGVLQPDRSVIRGHRPAAVSAAHTATAGFIVGVALFAAGLVAGTWPALVVGALLGLLAGGGLHGELNARDAKRAPWMQRFHTQSVLFELFEQTSNRARIETFVGHNLHSMTRAEAMARFGREGVGLILQAAFVLGSFGSVYPIRHWDEGAYPMFLNDWAEQIAGYWSLSPSAATPEELQQNAAFSFFHDETIWSKGSARHLIGAIKEHVEDYPLLAATRNLFTPVIYQARLQSLLLRIQNAGYDWGGNNISRFFGIRLNTLSRRGGHGQGAENACLSAA